MNNTMTTSPNQTRKEQQTRKPAYNGLYLVRRNDSPAAGRAQAASAGGPPLDTSRKAGTPEAAKTVQGLGTRSAESIRMKLVACFGAFLTAPVVWCLHTLLLSHQTR